MSNCAAGQLHAAHRFHQALPVLTNHYVPLHPAPASRALGRIVDAGTDRRAQFNNDFQSLRSPVRRYRACGCCESGWAQIWAQRRNEETTAASTERRSGGSERGLMARPKGLVFPFSVRCTWPGSMVFRPAQRRQSDAKLCGGPPRPLCFCRSVAVGFRTRTPRASTGQECSGCARGTGDCANSGDHRWRTISTL